MRYLEFPPKDPPFFFASHYTNIARPKTFSTDIRKLNTTSLRFARKARETQNFSVSRARPTKSDPRYPPLTALLFCSFVKARRLSNHDGTKSSKMWSMLPLGTANEPSEEGEVRAIVNATCLLPSLTNPIPSSSQKANPYLRLQCSSSPSLAFTNQYLQHL